MNQTPLRLAVLCGAACLAASCHPNRPDVPATVQTYTGTGSNKTYGTQFNCRLTLRTYKGHTYVDGTWCAWGSSHLIHDGKEDEIEGYRNGSTLAFVNVPSALNRGVASTFQGQNDAARVDAIDRSNKTLGTGSMRFFARMTGSTISGSWTSTLSATDRQQNPSAKENQSGTFSLRREQ